MVIIPTFSDPSYSQVTDIDGASYALVFRWSQREAMWRLDLFDVEGTALATSIPLHVGTDLLGRARRAGASVPPGYLMVYDASGDNADPGLLDLASGARCVLCYVTLEELQAA